MNHVATVQHCTVVTVFVCTAFILLNNIFIFLTKHSLVIELYDDMNK